MEDAGQRERMGQPVGFLDVLDPGAWSRCVDRPDLQGPWACGWDGGAEKDQHTAGPHSLQCQCGQDTGASGAQPQVGGQGPGLHRGCPRGEVDVGVTILDLSDAPTFAVRGNTGQAGTGQLACGPADGLPASGWAGQCVPGPEGSSLRPRSASTLRSGPPCAQREAESPRPRADFCPFQCHPSPVASLSQRLPATATLVGPWGSLGECAFCRTARDAHAQPMSATVAGQRPVRILVPSEEASDPGKLEMCLALAHSCGQRPGDLGAALSRVPPASFSGVVLSSPHPRGRTPPAPARRRLGQPSLQAGLLFPFARKQPR